MENYLIYEIAIVIDEGLKILFTTFPALCNIFIMDTISA